MSYNPVRLLRRPDYIGAPRNDNRGMEIAAFAWLAHSDRDSTPPLQMLRRPDVSGLLQHGYMGCVPLTLALSPEVGERKKEVYSRCTRMT